MTTHDAASHHQRVGWLELFYDLVFVVVIEQLTHLLHDNPSHGRIWLTIGLTVVVWLAWFNVSALTNATGEVGPRGRPLIFVSMAGMGVLALGIESVPHGHVATFVIGYAIARTAVWVLWMRRRPFTWASWARPVIFGPVLSCLWLAPAFLHSGRALVAAFVLLSMAESSLPFIRSAQGEQSAIHGPHMVERIGLLLMIVLGESVVQIVHSLEGERGVKSWIAAGIAMALLCALWWLIYEATVSKLEEAVERDDTSISDFIGSSQLGIIAGLILVAAGLADAIHNSGPSTAHPALHRGSLACLCLGIVMIQLGVMSLTRRAFAINLGLGRRWHDREARQRERRERREQLVERSRSADRPAEPNRSVWTMLIRWAVLVAPPFLTWKLGVHWAPWVVLTILLSYLLGSLWIQGAGERRIRAYFAENTGAAEAEF